MFGPFVGVGLRAYSLAKGAVEYLFRDEFTTADAAPITSPRTCEPGPGTLTVEDANSVMSISGGEVVVNGAAAINSGIVSEPITRAVGTAFLFQVKDRTSISSNARFGVDPLGLGGSSTEYGFDWSSATTIRVKLSTAVLYVFYVGVATQFGIIMRGTGGFLFYKNTSDNWVLLWVYNADSGNLYAKMWDSGNYTFKTDSWRVAQLPAPFDTDNGIATDSIVSPVETNTFTHEADCLIEFTLTTLPSSGVIEIYFRTKDASNRWKIKISSTGTFLLYEDISGYENLRRSTSSVLSGGERIVIVANGTTITGFYNSVQAWSQYSANNFKTETDGKINSLGTGGVISNLITWPRTLSGTAATILDQYTA